MIEVCYIIGSSALSKGQPDIAVRWLERVLKSNSCSNQDSESSDLALKDMRLLILHTLGECFIMDTHQLVAHRFSAGPSPVEYAELKGLCTPSIEFLEDCKAKTLVAFSY